MRGVGHVARTAKMKNARTVRKQWN